MPELQVLDQRIEDDRLIVEVQSSVGQALCPRCLKPSRKVLKDDRSRLVRDLNALEFKVFLHLKQRRFLCLQCQTRFVERFFWIAEKARMTKRLQSVLLNQSRSNSLLKTAENNRVSYRQMSYLCFAKGLRLAEQAKSQRFSKRIGVDEFAIRKGHNYATAITDLVKREICGIGEKRTSNTLKDLLGEEADRLKKVREVTLDMWKPFHKAIKEVLPKARRTIDRFHVERYFSKAVAKCRQRLSKENPKIGKQLKKHRTLFVTQGKNLSPEKRQIRNDLLGFVPELKRAVRILEALRHWYQTPKAHSSAVHKLAILVRILKMSKIAELEALAKTLETWQVEIANYFLSYSTNGISEGFNTKIKLIKRSSYGRLTFAHLQARIFLECFHPT